MHFENTTIFSFKKIKQNSNLFFIQRFKLEFVAIRSTVDLKLTLFFTTEIFHRAIFVCYMERCHFSTLIIQLNPIEYVYIRFSLFVS